MRPRPAAAAGVALAALVAVTACSSKAKTSTQLPSASALLQQASQAMATVTSAHFTLAIDGSLGTSLDIKSAAGEVSRDGDAQATVQVNILNQLVSGNVIITGGTIYIKVLTGGYQSEKASDFYDVSQLLDPDKGVANLLAQATNGSTLGSATIDNTPTYEVQASFPTTILTGLASLAPGQSTVTGDLWIAQNGSHLIQAKIPLKIANASSTTVVTADLSNFNLPVSVSPPPTSG